MSWDANRLTLPGQRRRIQVKEHVMRVRQHFQVAVDPANAGAARSGRRSGPGSTCGRMSVRPGRLAGVLALALVAGCGSEYYQERLGETARQFAYYHTLDENLAEKWIDAGIELRVPEQFEPDLVSESVTGENDEIVQVLVPRQPEYFENVELPGLVGSWQAPVDSPSAGSQPAAAYLYVLTNREMFLDDELRNSAGDFHTLVLEAVCAGAGIEPPEATRPPWNEDTFPPVPERGTPSFAATRNTFNWISLVSPNPVGGVIREFRLYLQTAGDIQTAYVYVIPTDVSSDERIHDRIELSFETLKVDATIPQEAPGGGAAPSGSQF